MIRAADEKLKRGLSALPCKVLHPGMVFFFFWGGGGGGGEEMEEGEKVGRGGRFGVRIYLSACSVQLFR